MTRLPLPDASNRETARQLVRASQMVRRAAADLVGYICITVDHDGDADIATNGDPAMLARMLRKVAAMAENGDLGWGEITEAERPEAN